MSGGVSGKRLMIAFLVFVAVFAAALVYFQLFAFYTRTEAPAALAAAGVEAAVPVRGWDGIDASTSPLKLRACFDTDPAAVAEAAEAAPDAEPLNAPFWFGCFDARAIGEDLEAGRAEAVALARDEPAGFDVMLAVYPDGRAYLWRQLGERYR
jgi:hypothetical protein